jgi:hypothetical protein
VLVVWGSGEPSFLIVTLTTTQKGLGHRHRKVRAIVLERDGHVCHWCGGYADQCDELVARADGGVSSVDNSVAGCGPCNSSRGGRLGNRRKRAARRHPFFGGQTQDPTAVTPLSPDSSTWSLSSHLERAAAALDDGSLATTSGQ